MKKIGLWSIKQTSEGVLEAEPVSSVDNTETEQGLEDLLVQSPDLLLDGVTLVGRQLPTSGGPLDLLGIDQDGRLVVFELKRGVLTRDAVAQLFDYTSDIANYDDEKLARLVEDHSGRGGIEKIEDFADFYSQDFPSSEGPLEETPKMILVGLGADDRARRIVDFLTESGIDIQLQTFHAFEIDGRLMLAKQIESMPPIQKGGTGSRQVTKEGNRQALQQAARSLGVYELLQQVAGYVDDILPAYMWPGKTAYAFSLQERTDEGRPTSRSYVAIYLNTGRPGSLRMEFRPDVDKVAGEAVDLFASTVGSATRTSKPYVCLEVEVTSENWTEMKEPLGDLLRSIVAGWKNRTAGESNSEPAAEEHALAEYSPATEKTS